MTFSLGKLMCLIAGLALVLAVVPIPLAILLSVVFSGLAALIAAVAKLAGSSKVRSATWVCASYPWLALASLYLTWSVAWWFLGHRPRSLVDDPKFIGIPVLLLRDMTWLLFLGTGPAAIACLLMVMHESLLSVDADKPGRPDEVTGLVIAPPLLWLGAILVFAFDPGRVVEWLVD